MGQSLEPEHEDLLARMVDVEASLPRELRGAFILSETHDGADWTQSGIDGSSPQTADPAERAAADPGEAFRANGELILAESVDL